MDAASLSRPTFGGSRPWTRTLTLPLAEDPASGLSSDEIYVGASPCLSMISCDAYVLGVGVTPHDPHSHYEDEVIIVLDGKAEMVLVQPDRVTRTHLAR